MVPTGAEAVCEYILRELNRRFPGRWLSAGECRSPEVHDFRIAGVEFSPKQKQRLRHVATFRDLFSCFSFRSLPRDSHLGLTGWLQGRYPLRLIEQIPSPAQMLDIQCEGQRYVTWLKEPKWQNAKIGRHQGAYEFLLHDLEHAHKFFGDPASHRGQVLFFRKIRDAIQNGFFDGIYIDETFRTDFDYLISDMNSHPVHLLKYLKAIVLGVHLRQTKQNVLDLSSYWKDLFQSWEMSQNETSAALKINNPGHEDSHARETVAAYFISRPKAAPQRSLC